MFDEKEKKVIYLGSDHAGFKAKEELKPYIESKGFEVTDLGCFSEEPCDYPDIAREVGEKVSEHHGTMGVLLCGSGIGVAMAANKIHGVRAVQAINPELAALARQHNDANVLTMGGRLTEVSAMKLIVDKFLETKFENDEERRVRRVEKVNNM